MHSPKLYFDRLLAYYNARLVRNWPIPLRDSNLGDRSIPMGLAIYDGLAKQPIIWDCLRNLTLEYWAGFAPDDTVVNRLRIAGVNVKNFDRKIFKR